MNEDISGIDEAESAAHTYEHLHQQMLAGDLKARNELVTVALPKTEKLVRYFILKWRLPKSAFEDLLGDAQLAVIEAVDVLNERDSITNVWAFLSARVRTALRQSRHKLSLVSAPPRTQRRNHPRDLKRRSLDVAEQFGIEPNHSAELLDEIIACCETDFEHDFVALKYSDATNEQLAAKWGKSTRWVQAVGQRIHTRLKTREQQ
jgi:DNA-directed RNA polymerase specialized sigma subunit